MLTVSAPLTLWPSLENLKLNDGEADIGSISCRGAERAMTGASEAEAGVGPRCSAHERFICDEPWVQAKMEHARERHLTMPTFSRPDHTHLRLPRSH